LTTPEVNTNVDIQPNLC